jgi:predicted RNA-binding Zn-ribbon protein involved in translation (DUF1610 family)
MSKVNCPTCGEVSIGGSASPDKTNKKKSVISGTCPKCGRSLNVIIMDMSKK